MISRTPSLSALGLSLVFGVIAYGGAELIGYERLADQVVAELVRAENASARIAGIDKSAISSWTSVTGVSGWARELLFEVVRAEAPDDKAAIEGALSNAAEVSPTWAAGWLDLAAARLASGAPMEQVSAAFRMSDLTGSHEGFMIVRRAIFGFHHWTALPEADRRIVVRDALATIGSQQGIEQRFREILAAKPKTERDDIRAGLTASGLATKELFQALGI